MENYKILQETEQGGFKITSYIEDLSEQERQERDNKISQSALKILRDFYLRKEQEE